MIMIICMVFGLALYNKNHLPTLIKLPSPLVLVRLSAQEHTAPMLTKYWWLMPFCGLVCWIGVFAAIAMRNYETSVLSSVLKPRNDMVKVALGVSVLAVLNNMLWLAIGKGTIINIFQQAMMLVFQMSVFQYVLKIFDPVQRWLSKDLVKKGCNIAKLFFGVLTLVLAVLIRVHDVYRANTLGNSDDYIALYILIMDFILCLFMCFCIWVFSNIYISVRRGINYDSAEEKLPEVFNLRKRWLIGENDLANFSHEADPNCVNVLKVEKIMIERLIFFMFLVLSMNTYKLSWGSSQYECSSRASCSPNITERNLQRAINSLSYWMPDVICMSVWLLLLVKPIERVTLPEERVSESEDKSKSKARDRDSADGGAGARKVRADCRSREKTGDLSFDTDESGIKLSIISYPLSCPSRAVSSDSRACDRRGGEPGQEIREIAVSCQEMVLFHRESGIPVATLFAGRDTFAVLFMSSQSGGVKVANAGAPPPEDSSWVEIGRSDCRLNKANPFFHAVFVVPDSPMRDVAYRFDLFNVDEDFDSSFHPDTADLASHELVASVHLSSQELDELTDSVARERPLREGGSLLLEYQSKSKKKEIIMSKIATKFSDLYVGIGGKMLISARKVRPFSQKFGEVRTVNDLPQRPAALPVNGSIAERSSSTSSSGGSDSGGASMAPGDDIFKIDAMVRSFITTTHGHGKKPFDVLLREELVESPYSFNIPAAYLRSLVPERVMELETVIERLGWKDQFMEDEEPSHAADSREWSQEFIKAITSNVEVMRQAVYAYEHSTDTFKKSKDKKSKELEFVPVNLHVHIFEMSSQPSMRDQARRGRGGSAGEEAAGDEPDQNHDQDQQFVCDFVTVGAFAAHSKKFKQGGLWHLMKQFEYRLNQISPDAAMGPSGDEDFLLPHQVWNIQVLQHLPLDPLLLHLAFKARERFDICVSQCLSSVAAGFLARIKLMSPSVLERVVTVGMLFQFESLLSTQGHELGMLSDFFCAIKFMDFVQVRVYEMPVTTARGSKPAAGVRVYREHELLILDLGFPPSQFHDLPALVKQGRGVAVVPVLFTVGINELQTYAETMAGKKVFHLQDLINRESLARVEAYFSLVMRFDAGGLEHEKAALSAAASDGSDKPLGAGRSAKTYTTSKGTEQNFVEDFGSKSASEGSTLWLQSPASSHREFSFTCERMESGSSVSADFLLGAATWGEVERAVGGFSLWTGTKKNAQEKDAAARVDQNVEVLLTDGQEIESIHIEDDGEGQLCLCQLFCQFVCVVCEVSLGC